MVLEITRVPDETIHNCQYAGFGSGVGRENAQFYVHCTIGNEEEFFCCTEHLHDYLKQLNLSSAIARI